MARKVEDKLRKKGDSSSIGKGRGRDFKGNSSRGLSGRTNDQKRYGESKWAEQTNETSQRVGNNRGRGYSNGGRGRYGNNKRGSRFNNMKYWQC